MTRKNFIALIASSVVGPAIKGKPVSSCIGARKWLSGDSDVLNNPYIKDGLAAMWDISYGIEEGVWKDCVGGSEIDISSCIVGDSVFIPRNGSISGICDALAYPSTVEMVIACTAQKQNAERFSGGCHVIRQSDWSPNNTRIYYTAWNQPWNGKYLGTNDRISIRETCSLCQKDDSIMHNGERLTYFLSNPNYPTSTTGDFMFNAIGDSSNTGLHIFSFRVYGRIIEDDELEYNLAIDRERFSI